MRSVNPLTRSDTLMAASHSLGDALGGVSRRLLHEVLLDRHGSHWDLDKLEPKPDEMPEAYAGAARQLESIPKEERPRVAKDVPGQEQIHLPVRCLGGAHDLKPAPCVRNAGDLLPISEDRGPVGVRPQDLHDLAHVRRVMPDECAKAVGTHRRPPPQIGQAFWAKLFSVHGPIRARARPDLSQ